jgi:hypothetical protein
MRGYQTLLVDLPLLHALGLPVDKLHSFYGRKTRSHFEGMGER